MTRGVWTGLLLGVLLALGPYPAVAQSSADAYFHEAAQEYVAGNTAAARRAVEQGLAVAPSNPRLQALLQKLRQGGRSQGRQDSSSANGSSRSQQNENSSNESSERGEDSSRSDQSDAQQPGPRSDNQSGANGSQSSSQSPSDSQQEGEAQRRPGRGRLVDTLSRAQAERLLQALEGQERQLLRRIQVRSATPRRVVKDW